MDINQMTKKEFLELPSFKYGDKIDEFNCIIIIPDNYIHDSGFRTMTFIPCKGFEPLGKIQGRSDVVHLNGIGGFNSNIDGNLHKVDRIDWSIDCLKKSRLLRLFCNSHMLIAGMPLSSFELLTKKIGGK